MTDGLNKHLHAPTLAGTFRTRTLISHVFTFSRQVAERFFLYLLPSTVTGGATAEGVLTGELIIEDSDDAYGVVDIAPDSAQRVDAVS